ncbi:MAG: trehalase family glycosidase [Bacteroidota bacterium]
MCLNKFKLLLAAAAILLHVNSLAQAPVVSDSYLQIQAVATDPLYTTYAAAMDRSRLYGDKAYKMDYYSDTEPLKYTTDQAGSMYTVWMVDKLAMINKNEFFKRPVVKVSFPDMALLEYMPLRGVQVEETFMVYSSTVAVVQMNIKNVSNENKLIDLYPILEKNGQEVLEFNETHQAFITKHYESRKRLISNLYAKEPYPENLQNVFMMDEATRSRGIYSGGMGDFYNEIKTDWYDENRIDSLNEKTSGKADFIALHQRFELKPGEEKQVRYYRGVQEINENKEDLFKQIENLRKTPIQSFVDINEKLFESIPRIDFNSPGEKLVYLSAFNLARASMLPPTEQTDHNFYVFSRNPKWGWGHGHQVLHESLAMLAYAYLDPESAQNSQRVYMEQQREDGLIAYRHGPRGPQTYPHKGEPTTSAPFFSWINWEVYNVSKDKEFLDDAYYSGVKYMNWLILNRDKDKDGLYEWGPYGIIENVRDWYNVIFQVSKERYLDIDKEDISDELECLDLSLMLIKESKSLAKMANELGKNKESKKWLKFADKTARLINKIMWDEGSGFYYHVDMKNHAFQFMDRDLKRMEIIGFMPMWAEISSPERADILLKHLTDESKFWRKNGVPTLAADDPYYSANVDYCCKWNGPVWLLWDYIIFDGLMNYGYKEEARVLADKMMLGVKTQLSRNHNFWESYSPDNDVLNCPPNYIWDAIMAKLLVRLYLEE